MQIFQKFVISGECMVLKNWKIMNWGLWEWSGGHEKGVLRAARTRVPFSGEYPRAFSFFCVRNTTQLVRRVYYTD